MRLQSDPPSTVASGSSNHGEKTIRQPWLKILRVAWLVAALAAWLVLGLSVPGYIQYIQEGQQGVVFDILVDAPALIVSAIGLATVLVSFLTVLLCLALAGLLFWRQSEQVMPLFVSFFLLGYGIINAGPAEALVTLLPGVSETLVDLGVPVVSVPTILLLSLFPNGQFVPRWTRWLAVLSCIPSGLGVADALMALPPWLGVLNNIGYVILMFLIVGAQVYRYRRVSGPAERQQTKWVVFGLGLWFLLIILVIIPYEVILSWPTDTPLPLWAFFVGVIWVASLAIIPLCLTIAVLRYRLYDIDVIIRKTLVYGLLTALLAFVYLGSVVLLQTLFGRAAGAQSPLIIVLSTLLIAALFAPLRRRVQELIDRRFYRRKYDAQQVLAAFASKARDEVELDELTAELARVVEETMRPEQVSLWLRRQ